MTTMKYLIVIILLLGVFQAYSQKKKKVDPKDTQIDTLTKTNAELSAKLDSVSKNYNGLYTTLKEKVLLRDYDPARLPEIIDSIRASRDSAASSAASLLSTPLKDSLSAMHKENSMLKARIDTMNVAMQKQAASNADKTKLMAELKDLKSLLDTKVITQAEYDEKKKMVMGKWQ